MSPPRMTLVNPKIWFSKTAFTPSTLSSAEPSWQTMWHGFEVEVLNFKHRSTHHDLDMRQECRTFKSVASRPCHWLLFDVRAQGARFLFAPVTCQMTSNQSKDMLKYNQPVKKPMM